LRSVQKRTERGAQRSAILRLRACCPRAKLGEPEPRLAPFDPARTEPVPHEEQIRALIERLRAEEKEREAEDSGE
jgi:hypothetical protein